MERTGSQNIITKEAAVGIEKSARDEGRGQETGEGREPSLEKPSLEGSSDVIMSLPSPQQTKPKKHDSRWNEDNSFSGGSVLASERSVIGTSGKEWRRSDRFPARLVLEKAASPVPSPDRFSSKLLAGEEEGGVEGFEEILYSLRALGEER